MPSTYIEFTHVLSDKHLTKSFSVDENGKIAKSPEPTLTGGEFRRVGVGNISEFATWLDGLKSNEAPILGRLVPEGERFAITTKKMQHQRPGALTRTAGNFTYPAGQPALVGLDLDTAGYPTPLKAKVKDAGGLRSALAQVFPELSTCGLVMRASVSSGIFHRRTGEGTGRRGAHLYVIAEDASDAPRFVKGVHDRLVLAGLCFPFVSDTGRPERIWYEANASLSSDELAHDAKARCPVVRPGPFLDTHALPDLDDDEVRRLATREAELRAEAAQEAKRKAQSHAEALGRVFKPTSSTEGSRAREVLDGDAELVLDDGRIVSVMDVLLNPSDFHCATCSDPNEPDYGGGRNKAVIYTTGRQPGVFSHAHGGIFYEFRPTAEQVLRACRRKP